MSDETEGTYTRKVRIYPNKAQVELFRKCLGATRYIFNKGNEVIKQKIAEAKAQRFQELDALAQARPCCARFDKRDARGVYMAGLLAAALVISPRASSHRATLALVAVSLLVLAWIKPVKRWAWSCCKERAEGSPWFCEKHSKDPSSTHVSYTHFMQIGRLRPMVMSGDEDLVADHPEAWQKEIPFDTRQGAVKELLGAYESAMSNKRNGNISRFDVGFKSRKAPSQVFHCRANAFNASKQTIFVTRLKKTDGKGRLRIRKRALDKLVSEEGDEPHGDFTVQLNASGAWYLCLPRKRKQREHAVVDTPAYRSAFLDPGVRTFQTFYSPDGICGKIGDGFCSRFLDPLAAKVDAINAIMASSETRCHARIRLRRRRAALYRKIAHKVDDLHWKTCSFLCTYFDAIFMPHFGTKDMVRLPEEGFRTIRSKTANNMLQLAHGRFHERLQAYARAKRRELFVVPEAYTTKTCGACGAENPSVGGAKVFTCREGGCGYKLDRDVHGARNICISTLSHITRHQLVGA